MLDACPVHPKGTMVIPMLWRISGYVVCMMGVKNKNHHTHPYTHTPRSVVARTGCGSAFTIIIWIQMSVVR